MSALMTRAALEVTHIANLTREDEINEVINLKGNPNSVEQKKTGAVETAG